MSQEMEFKNIVAQYSKVAPEEMTNEMRFREDLGFSSLDFMSFLGELEDTFDIELEENEVMKIVTLGEALAIAGKPSVGGNGYAGQKYIRRKRTKVW